MIGIIFGIIFAVQLNAFFKSELYSIQLTFAEKWLVFIFQSEKY